VPRLVEALQNSSVLADVNSDQQQTGLETDVVIDRDTASRLGIVVSLIDSTLYDAFGQRQVSTIYSAVNQYHVVMEVDPRYWQDPAILKDLYVSTAGASPSGTAISNAVAGTVARSPAPLAPGSSSSNSSATANAQGAAARNAQTNALANTGRGGTSAGSAVSTARETMVPLAAFSHFEPGHTPLAVNHQGLFVASTISYNLAPGASLSDAATEIRAAMKALHAPATIHGSLQGTARLFQESLANELLLIPAALAAVYIVLGILYESFIHPITILSTLFSAGVGAVLALLLFHTEFSIIAMIGVILLIGIVSRANGPSFAARRDFSRLRFAISSDHDDDVRCDFWRNPADAELRRGGRDPPPAGHCDRRRADRQPTLDALHHAGALSLPRPVPPLVEPAMAPPISTAFGRHSGTFRVAGSRCRHEVAVMRWIIRRAQRRRAPI
jgi:multidrug efflux pump